MRRMQREICQYFVSERKGSGEVMKRRKLMKIKGVMGLIA